jgi:hypothetical protein
MFSPPIITATPNAGYRPANSERHYCRNPRCRLKLPEPVSNEREAFCCQGCHTNFYRTRCRICEAPLEQPQRGGTRLICKRAKCRSAWRAGLGLGRYPTLNGAESIPEVPVNKGPKVAVSDDRARPWRIVAGRELTPTQLHCAIIPPDPKLVARLTRQHKQYYCDTAKSLIGPTDLPINKIPGLTRPRSPIDRAALSALPLPADLTIPDFLRRARATP